MSRTEIDAYLAGLEEPKRSTLRQVRRTILAIIPDADQCISYGTPAFRVRGKVVAGFAAFKNHLSYLPHSGSVFPELAEDLTLYVTTSGALHFAVDSPFRRNSSRSSSRPGSLNCHRRATNACLSHDSAMMAACRWDSMPSASAPEPTRR